MIRVGRIQGNVQPSFKGFEKVVVMMKSSKYWELSPYYLKSDEGWIMENMWQFSKVYEKAPKSNQKYSRWDPTVIWDHPAETHVEDGELTDEYWAWRKKGFENDHAVRYPVGFHHRKNCLYAFVEDPSERLDYIESRKKLYVPIYINLVKKEDKFRQLVEKLRNGKNLLILEVDGPHGESLDYYKERYGVDDDFITGNTMLATMENLDIMLNDGKYPFGHGYCLAAALLSEL